LKRTLQKNKEFTMANYSYPGVYIEEIPSGVRTITGVATSVTAFVGRARRGPINEPVTINNFGDYERIFGGLWAESAMGYAVRDFYLNGGSQAIIVRLYHPVQSEEEKDEARQAALRFRNEIVATVNGLNEATVASVKEYVAGTAGQYATAAHSKAEKDAVATVAKYVANAPSATTAALVEDAACQKANEYPSDHPGKEAATQVANAASLAALLTNATPDDVAEAVRSKAEEIVDICEAAKGVADAAKTAADTAIANGDDEAAVAAAAVDAARTQANGFQDKPEEFLYADRVAGAAEAAVEDEEPSDPVAAANEEAVAIEDELRPRTEAATAVARAATAEAWKGVAALLTAAESAAEIVAPLSNARLGCDSLQLAAVHPGAWGNDIRARVDNDTSDPTDCDLFNLAIRDGQTGAIEIFRNVTIKSGPRQVDKVLEMESRLVRVCGPLIQVPAESTEPTAGQSPWDDDYSYRVIDIASDGEPLVQNDFLQEDKKGLYALEKADLFNLLCIPPYNADQNVDTFVISAAAAYCEKRRAMLILDSPSGWGDKEKAKSEFTGEEEKIGTRSKNAAFFFPRFKQVNPLHDGQIETFAACGAVAGIFARTDATRGVWKAPAGLDASLVGVLGLSVPLTDQENGELNPLGINCFRTMPGAGHVIWGARTLRGNDRLASEWKYIPVRRTALYIEESLYRGTQWVVFEPNDEPLWAQIRLNIGAFMYNLFRQGAFQGKTPREAYFVKCDKETTTPNDINLGIVNIVVGFAPLKPAEFVVIKLQQMAGQIQA
jgi:phage tail sheath protein FI